jgi:hypothetical protein
MPSRGSGWWQVRAAGPGAILRIENTPSLNTIG